VLAAVLVSAAVVTGCAGGDDGGGGGSGRRAPAFDLESLSAEGDRVTLAEYAGTPVVLNFWASWCAPCVKEMPLLERVHRRVGDAVQFVGIDGNDSRRLARELMAETGVTYPSGYDPGDGVYREYRLVGRPTTVFIGADGRIRGVHAGELRGDDLDRLLAEHLGVERRLAG
jgi:cytochrome c biogenesis protein CcmG/thiol:disulfide interchange protein DsbE